MAYPIRKKAPAKVNLTLAVRGRRSDGFHDIESWVMPVGLFDELLFAPADVLSLAVAGPVDLPLSCDDNVVVRAARALADAAGVQAGASITLAKDIPVAAGLGGGSSDAAAALVALNELWRLNWPVERLCAIAAQVGSDVPLFLHPGPAVIRGRGEIVEPLRASWSGWLVLIVPPLRLATADVYARWRDSAPARHAPQPWLAANWKAAELAPLLFNDLEGLAFGIAPALGELHDKLDGLAGRPVRMTGSGSCLFAIFDTDHEARDWQTLARGAIGGAAELRVVSAPYTEPTGDPRSFPVSS